LKACVIQNFANAGGLQRVAVAVIELLNTLGFQVYLCSLSPPNKDVILQSFGKEPEILNFKLPRFMFGKLGFYLARSVCRDINFGVDADLYVNTMAYSLPFVKINRNANLIMYIGRVPVVPVDKDRKNLHYIKKIYARCLNPVVTRKLDKMLEGAHIISTSSYVRDFLTEHWKVNSEVINPPVDVDEYRCSVDDMLMKDNKSIALVGRFDPWKRLETGIYVAENINDCKVHILGGRENGAYLKFIKSSIETSSARQRIKLYIQAPLPERVNTLKHCGVYLHPADHEDFGISIVEAMAAGCIPVVHNSGGPKEFVPKKWRYDNFEECLTKVEEAFQASREERLSMVRITEHFHENYFKEAFTRFVAKSIGNA
jgi:glycosyltransferase involved in cell wall biosynthesis